MKRVGDHQNGGDRDALAGFWRGWNLAAILPPLSARSCSGGSGCLNGDAGQTAATVRVQRMFSAKSFACCVAIWMIGVGGVRTFAQQSVLPPLKAESEQDKLSLAAKVLVREFHFVGNTVFTSAELARVVSSYAGREIDSGQLEDARRALTLHYVNNGYINSGAVLEDQTVTGGIITFQIIEGKLSDVHIEGNKRLRTEFIQRRIRRGAGTPLNMNSLQQTLLLLKDNPNLRRINAELKPAAVRGESDLEVSVAEKNPWHLGLQGRNDRPPSVGAEVIEVLASHQNLTGNSDPLEFRYGVAQRSRDGMKLSGVDNLGASYRVPLTVYDTTLQLGYSRGDFAIVEAPFDTLDIESRSDSYSVGLHQPLYRTPQREFSVSLVGDRRHSESFLLGEPFSFSAGAVNGEATVSVLRFVSEFVNRSQAQVIALRSTFNWGIDALGSTDDGTQRNGQFLTWLGQAQYVRRLSESGIQLMLGTTFQWSDDPLLSLEQFSLGGANTVRGYRENQIVRDMGVLSSVEVRVPVLSNKAGAPVLQVAPFLDYGNGWNRHASTPAPRDLLSAGIGLLFTPHEKIHAQLYWGHAFRDLKPAGDRDAQDYGLHFKVLVMAF